MPHERDQSPAIPDVIEFARGSDYILDAILVQLLPLDGFPPSPRIRGRALFSNFAVFSIPIILALRSMLEMLFH